VKILPNLPPLDGAGAPGFRAQQWHAFFVPAAASAETIGRLYAAVSAALNTEEMAERIDAAGATKLGLSPSESQSFFLDDIRYWADVVKRIKLDL
jgi:tripartite-type tricarboxylate transporter receptor subunit TctC